MYCFVCVGREQLATARSRLASFVYVLLRWTMCAKVNRLVFLPHLDLQMPLGQIVKKKKNQRDTETSSDSQHKACFPTLCCSSSEIL